MAFERPTQHRIVVTGVGAITNLGLTAKETWEGMREGRSGIGLIDLPEFKDHAEKWTSRIAGQVRGFSTEGWMEHREAKRVDRFALLGLGAAREAVLDSGIDFAKEDAERCGVVFGSGVGGITTIEEGCRVLAERGPDRLSPFTVPRLMANAAAGNISITYGLKGPVTTHVTACASSGHAIGEAVDWMRWGRADVMVVGGAEAAVSPVCIGSFMTMRALSTRNDEPTKASRPFDKDRDGFVMAEGSAAYILETEQHAKARGATIYAELVGHANAADAYHITAPDEAGGGATRSMKWAMQDARLNPEQIGYINAHGTSTPLGDKAEVEAVLGLFGDHARASKHGGKAGGGLIMSSTKSMHGHALGASGAIEMLACIHAVRDGVIAPTINLETPDEGFDLDFAPHHARERRVDYAMNNTFGFGGHNVTLIIGRYQG